MAKRLTDISIRNLKPGPQRREISDHANGLFLILQSSGYRSWAMRCRLNGKTAKVTLGDWPAITLSSAREQAASLMRKIGEGHDPRRAKADAAAKAAEAKRDTVANICAEYMRREGYKLRSAGARESILRRLVYPVIGTRPITEVRRSEIARLCDKVEDHNGPRMADVCLATLRTVFHWHEKRSDEFRSPIIRGMQRQKPAEHRRTRILDDDEIRAVWAATADNAPFSALVRFLLLSAARRTEAAGINAKGEIDGDGIWTLPATRSKNKAEVIRPLSKAAREVLVRLPRIEGCDFAFPSATNRTPIRQFSTYKAALDRASGVKGWRLHDARRTACSLLGRAGVNSDVAEKCLGHSRGDIVERYDQHKYIDEMRHAFEALAALIERIVDPQQNVVVPLRGA